MINSWLSFPWKFAFMKTIFIVWAKDLELHNDTPWHKHSEVSWAEHLSAISICIQKNINGKKQMSLTQEEFRNQNGSPKRRTKKVFSCFQKAPQNFFCAVHSVKLILISWVQTFPLKTNTYLGKKSIQIVNTVFIIHGYIQVQSIRDGKKLFQVALNKSFALLAPSMLPPIYHPHCLK